MSSVAKCFLWAEVTVCFAPAVLLLGIGLIALPVQIRYLIAGDADSIIGALTVIALTTGGAAGLVALGNLLNWVMDPPSIFIGRWYTLTGAIAGSAALLPYTAGEVDSPWWRLVGWMPLVCTVHLMYLGRTFLFRSRR